MHQQAAYCPCQLDLESSTAHSPLWQPSPPRAILRSQFDIVSWTTHGTYRVFTRIKYCLASKKTVQHIFWFTCYATVTCLCTIGKAMLGVWINCMRPQSCFPSAWKIRILDDAEVNEIEIDEDDELCRWSTIHLHCCTESRWCADLACGIASRVCGDVSGGMQLNRLSLLWKSGNVDLHWKLSVWTSYFEIERTEAAKLFSRVHDHSVVTCLTSTFHRMKIWNMLLDSNLMTYLWWAIQHDFEVFAP